MLLTFNEESESKAQALPPWKILIVDDEVDVHLITKMALKRFELDGQSLEFEDAYSGAEARAKLESVPDIALVLLDVVMETDDAGLKVAQWIREELGNRMVRIVLRTGQPGHAPEEEVIKLYDINDYKQKTELDRTKLFTTVVAALRAYRDLKTIDASRRYEQLYRSGLEKVIQSTAQILETRTITQFFDGLLQQVASLIRSDSNGVFVTANVTGAGTICDADDYTIVARCGDHPHDTLDEEIRALLDRAKNEHHSLLENDTFVAYFPSSNSKVSLLYLKGVREVSEVNMQLLNVFCSSIGIAFDNLMLNREIVTTQEELLSRLGNAVESRSKESGNHIRRISEFSYLLAKAIGLDDHDAETLRQAAPMHDVGKIATPDAVLLKAGKLDEREFSVMRNHPQIGYDILKGSDRHILQAASIIALQHHEKYDGSGYPNGLAGEEIHVFARIIAVADVFDALLHRRCYKEPWPVEKVLELIQSESGRHFDPRVVAGLFSQLDEILRINALLTDHGEH